MEKSYKTKQRLYILEYLKQNLNEHITADKIIEHFKLIGKPIGKATVYRYLENLVEEDMVRKYAMPDRNAAACFQYVDKNSNCNNHYHMKCIKCGALIHIDCNELEEVANHIYNEHNFKLDIFKTVLYGTCESCMD